MNCARSFGRRRGGARNHYQGSPAHRLGFQRGDIVVSINEKRVATSKDLERLTAQFAPDAGRSPSCAADARCRRRSGDDPARTQKGGAESVLCGGARCRHAAAARRQAASAKAFRSRRPGPSARAGRRADAHAVDPLARLADLLGSARHRQDHGGAAARAGNRSAFRADFGDLHRRRRPEESVRAGACAPRKRAGHAAVRRRDSPLQPRPAGFLSAGDGGRHHRAGRRHHRKSVLRTERAAAVARPRAGVPLARTPKRSRNFWRVPSRSKASRCRSTPRRAPR